VSYATAATTTGSAASSTTRVLVADDQHLVRAGFRLILDAQPGIEVVGEAADGAECVEMARRLRPDVCLVDIRMPALDGLEVTRILAGPESADRMRVVVVTTFDQDDYVHRALHNGACGFLLKDASPALLIEAVRAAQRGDALISPAVTVRLLRQLEDGRKASSAAGRPPRTALTERELDVARLVAMGHTNQEICADLFLSLGTVKTHLTNIQSKLGVRNRVEIAAWAWATGTVSQGPGFQE
jgi:DNA-binding NarL/FixJ family response regulator